MADRTERLTLSVSGTPELAAAQTKAAALRQELVALQAQLASLKAAQAQIMTPGARLTPALLKAATGGGSVDPSKLTEDMAAAQKAAAAKVVTAKNAVNTADKQAGALIIQQNRAMSEYIALMAKSTQAADREWAAQQRLNQQRQKGQDLSRQLGMPEPGGGSGSTFLGAGVSGSNRVAGFAGNVAQNAAYGLGAATGLPGAGHAASGIATELTNAVQALPPLAKGIAAIAALLGIGLSAKATADSVLHSIGQQIAGAAPVGMDPLARDNIARAILEQGKDFSVPVSENTQNAQTLGQMGVSGADLPKALALGYATATDAGMDLSKGVDLVGTLMTKQKMSVSEASATLQRYANAAGAAGISLQRIFDIGQQMAASAGPLTPQGIAQMASLQAQLGTGVNVASLMAPAETATGFGAIAEEGMLGLTQSQFRNMQKNDPAALFDRIAQRAKASAGGNTDVLAGLLGTFGMDTSSLTSGQVNTLAQMIQSGPPGQALAYYNKNVKGAAGAALQSTGAFVGHQAGVRGGTLSPADMAKIQAAYAVLFGLESPSGMPNGSDTNPNKVPTPPYTGGAAPGEQSGVPGTTEHPVPAGGPGSPLPGATTPIGGQTVGSPGAGVAGNTSLLAAITAELPAKARPFAAAYMAASLATGVPIAVLAAQDMVESSFDPTAYNASSGAMGLGQIIPTTYAQYGKGNPYDPAQNIMASARLDQANHARLGSWTAAEYAYGPGTTDPGYMGKIATAIATLAAQGLNVDVTVTVKDQAGRIMPSTSTIKKGPTTAPAHVGHR